MSRDTCFDRAVLHFRAAVDVHFVSNGAQVGNETLGPAARAATSRVRKERSDRFMTRNFHKVAAFALASAFVFTAGSASAGQRMISENGAWRAIVADQGAGKVCFVIASPKERLPAGLKRDPGFAFVTKRGRTWELSFDFGYRLAQTNHTMAIDGATHTLFSKGSAAWLNTDAEESRVVEAMKAGHEMRVDAKSGRGNPTTDVYDLGGFTASFEAVDRECGR